jgi:aldose 1-epimerase
MSQAHAETAERSGQAVVILRDVGTGSEAHLYPGLGWPCLRFRVADGGGEWSVLAEPTSADELLHRSFRYGLPILYPWPNRIRDGRFTFEGTTVALPLPSNAPHAIHGLVRDLRWQVLDVGVNPDGAYARAFVECGGDSSPFPFRTRATAEYRLTGSVLSLAFTATNIGDGRMPFGLGIHPWFDVPLTPEGRREETLVRIPARSQWVLDALIPTGEIRAVAGQLPIDGMTPLGDASLDHVLTDLTPSGDWIEASIASPGSPRRIVVRANRSFREQVVYAPPDRPIVCLEPYTCPSDAFNLASAGHDAHVLTLEPGESWTGRLQIEGIVA